MKQVVQSSKLGGVTVIDVPTPVIAPAHVLVQVRASAVSSGTEKMAVDATSESLVKKAFNRPDLAQKVVDRALTEGVGSAFEAVRARRSKMSSLGYSNAGKVLAVGEGVLDIRVGDRVACGGADCAVHAETVCVPMNLVARIPEGVGYEQAAFTTIGTIALHGVRMARLDIGSSVAIIGLGLIGLFSVQLARASGCKVYGFDPQPDRCRLSENLGCQFASHDEQLFRDAVLAATGGVGADAVIIAAATSSNGPVELAGSLARSRAAVISVGAVGNNLPRTPFFLKELEYRVSRSYGPGRYDATYEEKGIDYPIDFVRWTENRNMQAFLDLLSLKQVHVSPLITHRIPVDAAQTAYELISGKKDPFLGVLLTYPTEEASTPRIELQTNAAAVKQSEVRAGVLGAGGFAMQTLLPAMRQAGVALVGIASGRGLTARNAAERFKFQFCTADENEIIHAEGINTVVILTPHNLHAKQTIAVLDAGRNVFCEKPLCITEEELHAVVEAYQRAELRGITPHVMVGFNRRFAPMVRMLKEFVSAGTGPLMMHYRVNAGPTRRDSWLNDPKQGGGRIVGEVCHFVDLLSFLAGENPLIVSGQVLPNGGVYSDDNLAARLQFPGGSIGTITYVSNGDKGFPKERLEVFADGGVAVLDNFRRLELMRDGRKKVTTVRFGQDKGHNAEWQSFIGSIMSGQAIPFGDAVASTIATIRIAESCRRGGASMDAVLRPRVGEKMQGEVIVGQR